MRAVIVYVLLVSVVVQGEGDASDKEAAVRTVFKEMLHIEPPNFTNKLLAAPKHMLDLYQQYVSREASATATTTIRNILPVQGEKGTLVFNVSSVHAGEEVRLAQLQLNRRRLHQRHHHSRRVLAPPYRVRLYRMIPGRLLQLASVPVTMVAREAWATLDITVPLRELLLDPRPSRHRLAVRFESPTGKLILPSHFLRGDSASFAFLVVFTEDSEENEVTEDGGKPSPRPPTHTHALVQRGRLAHLFSDEEDNTPQIIPLFIDTRERRTYTRNATRVLSSTPSTLENSFTITNQLVRKARSVIDNQLPDDDDNHINSQVPEPSPETIIITKSNLPHFFEDPGKNLKIGKKGKRKKGKKQKTKPRPSDDRWQNMYERREDKPGACLVRKMTVNFAEIGWGEWIIYPDKFDANYCVGSCRFPLTEDEEPLKALKPSNHATLQSLVHALGHNSLVPAPSCVPHHMSAVTLLYYDQTLNIVLKNYPSMVVESCACR